MMVGIQSGYVDLNELLAQKIQCPYCGEYMEVLLDASVEFQDYIEDCQVCCQPINFVVRATPEEGVCVEVSTDY